MINRSRKSGNSDFYFPGFPNHCNPITLGQWGDQTSQSQGKSTLNTHGKDWCWSWSSRILAPWYEQLTYWKSPWCWEQLRAEGEEGVRGWDGWTASLMQWTWTWANSGRWWGTGRPGALESMGLSRVRHDWATEQWHLWLDTTRYSVKSKICWKLWTLRDLSFYQWNGKINK